MNQYVQHIRPNFTGYILSQEELQTLINGFTKHVTGYDLNLQLCEPVRPEEYPYDVTVEWNDDQSVIDKFHKDNIDNNWGFTLHPSEDFMNRDSIFSKLFNAPCDVFYNVHEEHYEVHVTIEGDVT